MLWLILVHLPNTSCFHIDFQIEKDSRASNRQKVKGLLHFLLKMEIVKFSHFLLDVINVLNILSRVTLDHNSSIADIFATMQSTVETLHMYQTRSDICNDRVLIYYNLAKDYYIHFCILNLLELVQRNA